jgi:hypothetical protein
MSPASPDTCALCGDLDLTKANFYMMEQRIILDEASQPRSSITAVADRPIIVSILYCYVRALLDFRTGEALRQQTDHNATLILMTSSTLLRTTCI